MQSESKGFDRDHVSESKVDCNYIEVTDAQGSSPCEFKQLKK